MTKTRQCPICAYTWVIGQNQQHSCEKKLRERVRALEEQLQAQGEELKAWQEFGNGCLFPHPFGYRLWPNAWPQNVAVAAWSVHNLREAFADLELRLRDESGVAGRKAILAMADVMEQDMVPTEPTRQGASALRVAARGMRAWANSMGLQAAVRRKWAFLHKLERQAQQKD